jgi:pimeloyl-ACP methyl ester carboxylesterase
MVGVRLRSDSHALIDTMTPFPLSFSKMRYTFASSAILILVVHSACIRSPQLPRITVQRDGATDEVPLKRWRIIGPFHSRPIAPLSYDYLQAFGATEASVTTRNLVAMTREHYTGSGSLPNSFANKVVAPDAPFVNLASTLSSGIDLVAYAACELYANEPMRTTLVVGSDDGVRVWLNNRLIVSTADDVDRRLRKYHHMVLIHLDRGANLLLVKVDQKKLFPQLWSFALALQTPRHALRMGRLNAVAKILAQNIYKPGEPLRLCFDLYDLADVGSISLFEERSRKPVKTLSGPISLTALSGFLAGVREGGYRCRLVISDEAFEESIYVGNALRPLEDYRRSRLAKPGTDGQTRMDTAALVTRFEHLLSAEHHKPADVVWQKKIVFLAGEMELMLSSIAPGGQTYRGRPGLHLRGYRSAIDETVQYYMVFVPRIYLGAPVPLVVHVHPTMSVHRPFLKSLIVAHPFDVEALCQQADKNGFALLWPWARGNSRGNSIGTADTFEALAAVRGEFNINEDRIYLEGTCEGGSEALLLAARFPHRFAAVAAISPITDETTMGDSVARRPNAAPRLPRWSRINSPIALAPNLLNIPLMVLHGQFDEMIPLSQSKAFVDECRKHSIEPVFLVLPNTGHSYAPTEPINLVMDFFQGKSVVRSPEHVVLSASSTQFGSAYWVKLLSISEPLVLANLEAIRRQSNIVEVSALNVDVFELDLESAGLRKGRDIVVIVNGVRVFSGTATSRWLTVRLRPDFRADRLTKCCGLDGGIDQALGAKFALVKPGGERSDVADLTRMLESFWQEEYFSELPFVALAPGAGLSNCARNSIIVLTYQTRGGTMVDHIEGVPAVIEAHRISFANRQYDGDGLAFQMVYPNPQCPGRYIVVMGETGTPASSLSRLYSPTGAWYDYIVWKVAKSEEDAIVDLGVFDQYWRKAISLKDRSD